MLGMPGTNLALSSFGGAFAGVTGDITYQYLNNGITRDNDNKVTGYSIGQAINNYSLNQTLRSGGIGAVMAPVGAKIVETSINKWGLQNNIDIDKIRNLDDFLKNPKIFRNTTPDELYTYLNSNNYNPKPLSRGSLKGIPYNDGGGFKVNWGGDQIIQYHPKGGHHGGSEYYKISSGKMGTTRYDINGNIIK